MTIALLAERQGVEATTIIAIEPPLDCTPVDGGILGDPGVEAVPRGHQDGLGPMTKLAVIGVKHLFEAGHLVIGNLMRIIAGLQLAGSRFLHRIDKISQVVNQKGEAAIGE